MVPSYSLQSSTSDPKRLVNGSLFAGDIAKRVENSRKTVCIAVVHPMARYPVVCDLRHCRGESALLGSRAMAGAILRNVEMGGSAPWNSVLAIIAL